MLFKDLFLCIGAVLYGDAKTTEWCVNSEDVEGRDDCDSDDDCLENGRKLCDKDHKCFGLAWDKNNVKQRLKLCRSNKMGPKTDGWRTMLIVFREGKFLLISLNNFKEVHFSFYYMLAKISAMCIALKLYFI